MAAKKRKRRSDSLYHKKYSTQLINGLRRDGSSVEKVCQMWGIVPTTYYKWIDNHPDFAEAHEHGKRDNMIWWQEVGQAGITGQFKLNAAAYNFTMSNLHGWNTKVVTETNASDEIRTININVLPSREQNVLKHLPEVIDVEPEKDE